MPASDHDGPVVPVHRPKSVDEAAPQRCFVELRQLAVRECVERLQGPAFIWLFEGVAVALLSGNTGALL